MADNIDVSDSSTLNSASLVKLFFLNFILSLWMALTNVIFASTHRHSKTLALSGKYIYSVSQKKHPRHF